MDKRLYNPFLIALFFLITLIGYLSLVIYFDNTNLTTSNGLYKSIDVLGWEKGTRFAVDSGGLLYAFGMGMIAKLIPDSWVTFYGTVADFFTYRKLTYIHSFFGALASTTVLIFAYQVTRDRLWSVLVALLHAVSAFILANSVSSEDIIPGYFFFCVSFLCFYQALVTEHKRLYLTMTTLSVLGAMFLHWTLFPPILCSYGLIALWMIWEDKKYIKLFTEQLAVFCGLIELYVIIANKFLEGHQKFLKVLYPSKAGPSSWVGFCWFKFESLYLGIGNFLVGGQNLPTFSNASSSNILRTILSWGVTLMSLSICFYTLRKDTSRKHKVLAAMGIGIFTFGQLENMYGSPFDPQFQVQPMFIITGGLIIIYFYESWRRIFKLTIPILICFVATDNFLTYKTFKGLDSQSVKGFQEFRSLFPKDQIKLVHLVYEGWQPWLMIFDYESSWDAYLKDVTSLNTPFQFHPGISVKAASEQIMQEINTAIGQGKRVIATTPWIAPDYIESLQIENVSKADTQELKRILLSHYKIKKIYNLSWGEFAEIERK